jgi:hypothetical protein
MAIPYIQNVTNHLCPAGRIESKEPLNVDSLCAIVSIELKITNGWHAVFTDMARVRCLPISAVWTSTRLDHTLLPQQWWTQPVHRRLPPS